ncbi:hypothetical protein B0A52_05978 [Exophiala mesophila]|uniref:Uncharacterized protein n=1 Tax=Exophiala mesophila TaxID=212818 RepID=A0A438N3Z3_EXOME|nr:hypothetical protein B0A52_05978 [Exophiala mesophila]
MDVSKWNVRSWSPPSRGPEILQNLDVAFLGYLEAVAHATNNSPSQALTAQMMAFENAAPGFDANVYTSPHVSIGLVTVDHYKTTLFHILELMMQ